MFRLDPVANAALSTGTPMQMLQTIAVSETLDPAPSIFDSNTETYALPDNPRPSLPERAFQGVPHPLPGTFNLSMLADMAHSRVDPLHEEQTFPAQPSRAAMRRWYDEAREEAEEEMDYRAETADYYRPPERAPDGQITQPGGPGYTAAERRFVTDAWRRQQQEDEEIARMAGLR